MINLLEEEYDAASGKYILHLTMGTGDTLSDLPSSTKPFNASNYSCFFDYGEPAEESTAVNEITGKLYTYSDGEWIEPEPAGETKIPVFGHSSYPMSAVITITDGDGNDVTLSEMDGSSSIKGYNVTYDQLGIIPTETGTITITIGGAKASSRVITAIVNEDGSIEEGSYTSSADVEIPEGTVAVFIDSIEV